MPFFHLWTMPNSTKFGISASIPLQDVADFTIFDYTHVSRNAPTLLSCTSVADIELILIAEVVCHPFNFSWFCL